MCQKDRFSLNADGATYELHLRNIHNGPILFECIFHPFCFRSHSTLCIGETRLSLRLPVSYAHRCISIFKFRNAYVSTVSYERVRTPIKFSVSDPSKKVKTYFATKLFYTIFYRYNYRSRISKTTYKN